MQLGAERYLTRIGVAAPLYRRRERIERKCKAFAGSLDRIRLGHCGKIASPSVRLAATKIRRGGKQLENDLYVIPPLSVNGRSAAAGIVHVSPLAGRLSLTPLTRMLEARPGKSAGLA